MSLNLSNNERKVGINAFSLLTAKDQVETFQFVLMFVERRFLRKTNKYNENGRVVNNAG